MTCYDMLEQMIILPWFGPAVLYESEIGRIPMGVGGVYLLHGFDPVLGAYPVLYAGKAGDLPRGLTDHLTNTRLRRHLRASRGLSRVYFSAAPVPDTEMQARIEGALIRILDPTCNRQVPTAEPLLVNLPPLHVLSLGGMLA